MKVQNDVETYWLQEQGKHFDMAVGYYELQMLDEAEAELSKIDPRIAAQSVPILTLQLAIAYCVGRQNYRTNQQRCAKKKAQILRASYRQCCAFSDSLRILAFSC